MTEIPPPPDVGGEDGPKRRRAPSVRTLKRKLADIEMERDALREQNNVLQQAAMMSNTYAQDARAAVEEQLADVIERLEQIHQIIVAKMPQSKG